MDYKRIVLFAGHYGSGKTNIAVNYALHLAREGKTVVAVLHDLQSAMQTADHILLLDKGCVAAQGTPETVFASGQLDRVFGVEVCRTSTEDRWQYYCKPFCN